MARDVTYYAMLNGVGPQRAMKERVTHVVYLTHMIDSKNMKVLHFGDLEDRLRVAQVHYTAYVHEGHTYVSISCPSLARNYNPDHIHASKVFVALEGKTEKDAKKSVIHFCKECAISSVVRQSL